MTCSKCSEREARVGQRYCKACHAEAEKARRRALQDELKRLRAQVSILTYGGSLADGLGLRRVG
jgi:predicted amidophosphoribosyltransferase